MLCLDGLEWARERGRAPPSVRICMPCLTNLRRTDDKPPPLSIANGNWIGYLPHELRCLRDAEWMLCSPVRRTGRTWVMKMSIGDRKDVPGQAKLRGHFILNRLDVEKVHHELPAAPRDAELTVLFGSPTQSIDQIKKFAEHLVVRREIVRKLLEDVLLNPAYDNAYFRGIRLARDELARLPEEGFVEDMVRNLPHGSEPAPVAGADGRPPPALAVADAAARAAADEKFFETTLEHPQYPEEGVWTQTMHIADNPAALGGSLPEMVHDIALNAEGESNRRMPAASPPPPADADAQLPTRVDRIDGTVCAARSSAGFAVSLADRCVCVM